MALEISKTPIYVESMIKVKLGVYSGIKRILDAQGVVPCSKSSIQGVIQGPGHIARIVDADNLVYGGPDCQVRQRRMTFRNSYITGLFDSSVCRNDRFYGWLEITFKD